MTMIPLARALGFALCCALTLLCLPSFCSAPESAAKDLAFETSSFMLRTIYRDVPHLNPDSAPDGAYGPVNRAWDKNHRGEWYIEEQRSGAELVAGGIAT